ncbi:MAG: hypothetical protein AB1941_05775 [Gemmatimonadota bacterium]
MHGRRKEANSLTLNLAHDVVTDRQSVAGARTAFALADQRSSRAVRPRP